MSHLKLVLICAPFAALLFPPAALASGFLKMPEIRETLSSHSACLSRLVRTQAEFKAQVKATVTDPDGSSQAILLDEKTKGVERSGRRQAVYSARLWYTNGRVRADLGQKEFSSSWEETNLECRGRVLITNNAQGYTLNSFEDLVIQP